MYKQPPCISNPGALELHWHHIKKLVKEKLKASSRDHCDQWGHVSKGNHQIKNYLRNFLAEVKKMLKKDTFKASLCINSAVFASFFYMYS